MRLLFLDVERSFRSLLRSLLFSLLLRFGEVDLAFLRGLLDLSLLLLLWPLDRLLACLLSLERERLLWALLELWESAPGQDLCDVLCLERDLFLRDLEWERERVRERDRRDLWERLEDRFFISAGSMAAAMVDWASLTLFITLSSSLAAACGVNSGGFTIALLEWLTFRGLSPNMTPFKVRALATESCWTNSTKAKRVGWVSSPAIRTNFTSPTCLKNSSSCSAVVVCEFKFPTYTVLLISSIFEGSTFPMRGGWESTDAVVSRLAVIRLTRGRFRFWSGAGVGIGSSPPPGIRLGTGVAGANSDRALASSGIFPAGQTGMLGKAWNVLFSLPAHLSHCILERKRAYTSPFSLKLGTEHPYWDFIKLHFSVNMHH